MQGLGAICDPSQKSMQMQYLPLKLSNFNNLKLYGLVLLVLSGVIQINFCSKTHGLGVRSYFVMKSLSTIFNILPF